MEIQVAITLLTIIVALLSIVIIAIMIFGIIVLAKLKKFIKNANRITDNVVSATAWLSPVKIFSEASRIFKRKK